jgi:O-antigen ligase
MRRATKIFLPIFCIVLLFLSCTLRSGLLIDKSFLPRYLVLSSLLLVTWIAAAYGKIRFRGSLPAIFMVLFFAWSMISSLWSIDAAEAIFQSQAVLLGLVLFLVVSDWSLRYPAFEKLFIKILVLVLIFSFVLAFYKISTLRFYDPYRVVSVSANNNLYSGFLLISLPLALSGFILLKKAWRYLSLFVSIMALFFIVILQTRAAYLGVAAAFLVLAIVLPFRYRKLFSRRLILAGIFSVILLAIGVSFFTWKLDEVRRQYFLQKIKVWEYFRSYRDIREKKIEDLTQVNPEDHSGIAPFDFSENYYSNANFRLIFWKKSVGLIADRPLTGVGAGNWRLAVASVKDPVNPEHTIGNFTYSEPHNEWIRIQSELGIVGSILAFFIFLLPLILVFFRILFFRQRAPVETVVYAAFITGFYVFACFDFPLKRIEHNIIFFTVFAFLLNKFQVPSSKRSPVRDRLELFPYILISLLLAFSLFLGVERFRGEYYSKKVFQYERKNDSLVIEYCNKAENPFYRITPNTLPVSWFQGVACYRLGQSETALQCFRRALTVTPFEVRVLNDYATALFGNNHPEQAIGVLQNALEIDPFFDDARYNLAAVFFLTGQKEKARNQILKCRDSEKKKEFMQEMKMR